MSVANPNLPLLESVAAALGPLCPRFVFVGGCVTGLLITEAATPPVRTTREVDVIVEVVSAADVEAAWQPSTGCIAARRPHFMGAAAGYREVVTHEVGSRWP
jgi:hypothetical protein